MLISFVLRLAPVALAAGELAGEVEHVLTGERGQFRDGEELRTWCAQHAPLGPSLPVPAPRPAAVDLTILQPQAPSSAGEPS